MTSRLLAGEAYHRGVPVKFCHWGGCRAKLPLHGPNWCEDHMPPQRKAERYRTKEAEERNALYETARWRRLSAMIRAMRPVCEECNDALSEDVHHVVAVADGGDFWEMDNLQALCKSCHAIKTGEERRRRS